MPFIARSLRSCWFLLPGTLFATEPAPATVPPPVATQLAQNGEAAATPAVDEQSARSTAVALNYCRASFHRLRQNPSRRVWQEEQQQILNNLNLNEIGDQEVISLYSAVLDEIGKERIADKERAVLKLSYRNQLRRQVLSNAFVLGAEVTTAQYVNAVRTGANGFWDYRTTSTNRDLDLWKVEKSRMTEVVDKSSKFLDTSWKMAQKRNIRDHWLVRGDDLDRLDAALQEQNPETRLRVLQRMERFMTCYPPYYYHVARTQQAQGLWANAIDTYQKLATLGHGHFRKDEMLSAGLANQALIQALIKHPDAIQTARRALEYSTGAWQANLVCARILQDGNLPLEAEEAILRNLDVDLERPQSLASLASLYQHAGQEAKLIALLSNSETVAELPATSLLHAIATLGPRKMPPAALQQLTASLYAYDSTAFGRSQVVFVASPSWSLERAETTLIGTRPETPETRGISSRGQTQLQFSPTSVQYNAQGEPELVMEIRYPESQPIRLHLTRAAWTPETLDQTDTGTLRNGELRDLFPLFAGARRRPGFMVSEVEVGQQKVALWDLTDPQHLDSQQMLVDQQQAKPAGQGHGTAHGAAKTAPVTIESVTPISPLVREKTKTLPNPDPAANPTSPKSPDNRTEKGSETHTDHPAHKPDPSGKPAAKPEKPTAQPATSEPRIPHPLLRGPVQLGDEIEELDCPDEEPQ